MMYYDGQSIAYRYQNSHKMTTLSLKNPTGTAIPVGMGFL